MTRDTGSMLAAREAGDREGNGLFGWLKRLVAGKELDALRTRVANLSHDALAAADDAKARLSELEERIATMTKQLETERRRKRELEERVAKSPEAQALRDSIRARECHCTTEVFLWPSVVFQPLQLAKAAWGARLWRDVPTQEEDQRTT